MKRILIVFGFVFLAIPIFAQDTTSVNTPDEQIIVNKKYDEQGNLIQFDSMYVHQWSSTDSTLQFSFPDNGSISGQGFPDVGNFFREFMGDSTMRGQHGFDPFDDDFLKHFQQGAPDSAMMKRFYSYRDSSFFNAPGGDKLNHFPPGFMPDMDELMQKFQQHFRDLQGEKDKMKHHGFQSKEQQDEWQQLMEKHRKEIDAFQKKWNEKFQEE